MWEPAGQLVSDLRAVKDEAEVESITRAVRVAEAALEDVRSRIVPGLFYWEGSVSLTGEGLRGRGYVELTGYGEGSRPPHLAAP